MILNNLASCFALPCNVYLKDRNGLLLECSAYQAESIGKTKEAIIGENSYHFLPKLYENMIKRNDQKIAVYQRPLFFIEHVFTPHGSRNYISYKTPLISAQSKIDIFGASILLNESNFLVAEKMSNHFSKESFRQLMLAQLKRRGSNSSLQLSNYEIDYLYHLLCGDKSEKISHDLALSRRTIEYYLAKTKDKYSSVSAQELLIKILLQFLQQEAE